jgi:hypothetical protein
VGSHDGDKVYQAVWFGRQHTSDWHKGSTIESRSLGGRIGNGAARSFRLSLRDSFRTRLTPLERVSLLHMGVSHRRGQ